MFRDASGIRQDLKHPFKIILTYGGFYVCLDHGGSKPFGFFSHLPEGSVLPPFSVVPSSSEEQIKEEKVSPR
jgi:hypothetical protein